LNFKSFEEIDRLTDELLEISKKFCARGDDYVYEKLREVYQSRLHSIRKSKTENESNDMNRESARGSDIKALLPADFSPRSLLDIGCAEGNITLALSSIFNLGSGETYGCDVRDVCDANGFSFSRILPRNKLPYADNMFDLTVSLMVLHHVEEDLDEMISEIYRITAPGGYFVLREHDCNPSEIGLVLDIMHGMYALVWSDPAEMGVESFCEYYTSSYRSKEDWLSLLERHGFKSCYPTAASESAYNILSADSSLVVKRHSRFVSNPFRYYYSVFQK
jgi:ubiquinone/menaquinone biosynthesis C-methylase UbiE